MPYEKLEVLLINAKGLKDSDFLCSMDPYVIRTCCSQEQKSNVATDGGSIPNWNETFVFTVSGDVSKLHLKIMDKDIFSADDFVGEAIISLAGVVEAGCVPPTSYNVVKDLEFKGEIRVQLTFFPERKYDGDIPAEDIGGWKDSS